MVIIMFIFNSSQSYLVYDIRSTMSLLLIQYHKYKVTLGRVKSEADPGFVIGGGTRAKRGRNFLRPRPQIVDHTP